MQDVCNPISNASIQLDEEKQKFPDLQTPAQDTHFEIRISCFSMLMSAAISCPSLHVVPLLHYADRVM